MNEMQNHDDNLKWVEAKWGQAVNTHNALAGINLYKFTLIIRFLTNILDSEQEKEKQ